MVLLLETLLDVACIINYHRIIIITSKALFQGCLRGSGVRRMLTTSGLKRLANESMSIELTAQTRSPLRISSPVV